MTVSEGEASSTALKGALQHLVARQDLTVQEAEEVVMALIEARVPDPLAGALLTALSTKGESTAEIRVFAHLLRQRARRFLPDETQEAVDLCGTGGAPTPSYNISTVAAFVVAGGGTPVTKHGNVSARGPCGSSDLLLALGLPVTRSVDFAEASYRGERLAFLHAPLYHMATTKVAPLRKSLGIRTVFNLMGPLTNPSAARTHVVGAFSPSYAEQAREVLVSEGATAVAAVHGGDGTDELTSMAPSDVLLARRGQREVLRVPPRDFLRPTEMEGGLEPLPPAESAREAVRILNGHVGARRGAVLLTAGLAFWMAGSCKDLPDAVETARASLDGGGGARKLTALQRLAQEREWS